MSEYKIVADHPIEVNGRLQPSGSVVSGKQEQHLIDQGLLVEIETKSKPKPKSKPKATEAKADDQDKEKDA